MRTTVKVALPVLLAAMLAALALLVLGAQTERAAHQSATPISRQQAISYAIQMLPDRGRGYELTVAELEPTSKHFDFTSPSGNRFSEDAVQECLVFPPLPPLAFLRQCRYYPVWVVSFSNRACETVITINALSGRFGGGGSGGRGACGLNPPPVPDHRWFQPTWG
jgi:hypothetical protein